MRRLSTRQVFLFGFLLTQFLLLILMMPHLMTGLCKQIDDELPKRTLTTNKFDRPLRVDNDEPLEVDHVDLSPFEGEV